MSLAIGQAGLAAGFLSGSPGLKVVHGINSYLLVDGDDRPVDLGGAVPAVRRTAVAAARRRHRGVVEIIQIMLGRLGVAGAHIFLGVLFVVMATLLTSYLFRPGFIPASR